ncbi:hypothetical protein QTP88_024120 [Uroleucon formosanum]
MAVTFKLKDRAVEPLLPIAVVRPESYTVVLGVQRGTEIIRHNLWFMYYKNKVTENKMLTLSNQHIHHVKELNLNVPLLRQEITENALEKTINSYTPREIYMHAIAKLVPIYKLVFRSFCE